MTSRSGGMLDDRASLIAFGTVIVAALGLVYLALTGVHMNGNSPASIITSSTPASLSENGSSGSTPTPPAQRSITVLVGGSEGWWDAWVGTEMPSGMTANARIGGSTSTLAALTSEVAAADVITGQLVLVQAGAQDIIEGGSGEQIGAGLQGLWQAVEERGGRPVAVLLLPSDLFPGSVAAVNELIRSSAADQGIAVVDLNQQVGSADGRWAAGYSDDGLRPNSEGTSALVEAARSQFLNVVASEEVSR